MKQENSRNNDNASTNGAKQNTNENKQQTNDRSQNPQDGSEWENYRTREMSGNEEKTSGTASKGKGRRGSNDPL